MTHTGEEPLTVSSLKPLDRCLLQSYEAQEYEEMEISCSAW